MNPRIPEWTRRRVWLVGASSGIGLAAAQALHQAGAEVIVTARQAQPLQAFVQAHPGSQAVPADVTDAQALAAAAAHIWAQGPVDLVCFCAGYYRPMRVDDFDLADALRHQDVNQGGAWHLLAAVLPRLLAQGHGHLSLVSSVAGFRGLPKSLAYGPTKAALIHLAEVLYLDLQSRGIGVSVVTPGFVRTPLTAQNDFAMPALMEPAEAAQAMLAGWAQGHFLIDFPKRFSVVLRLLRCLPYRLYFWLVHRATGL
jgi:NAD(P)-dependent dehydrogenase (short-subunit alcohol dehydrogenase family)